MLAIVAQMQRTTAFRRSVEKRILPSVIYFQNIAQRNGHTTNKLCKNDVPNFHDDFPVEVLLNTTRPIYIVSVPTHQNALRNGRRFGLSWWAHLTLRGWLGSLNKHIPVLGVLQLLCRTYGVGSNFAGHVLCKVNKDLSQTL